MQNLKKLNQIHLNAKRYSLNASARGTSLIETVVYVALTALLSLLVVEAVASLSFSFKSIRATRDIGNSALASLDRIAREVRNADALAPGGEFGTASSKLILSYDDPAVIREFSLAEDNTLHLFENGEDLGALTSSNIVVTDFRVDLSTTTDKTAVRVTMTLEDGRTAVNPRSATFYTAAAMRNLY